MRHERDKWLCAFCDRPLFIPKCVGLRENQTVGTYHTTELNLKFVYICSVKHPIFMLYALCVPKIFASLCSVSTSHTYSFSL